MLDKRHVDRVSRSTSAPNVVGLMVGWFPDRRGFACGIVAAGYGMGAILTTFPISGSLAAVGPQSTLITFGLIFGAIGLLAAQGMKRPPTNSESSVPGSTPTRTGVPPLVMLGEIFSLFPSTLTDTFGERHATTNYGFLYMAQGIGSIVGAPLAAWLHEVTGNWIIVFAVMIAMDFLAAIMAIAVLKPLRRGYLHAPNALTENAPLPI